MRGFGIISLIITIAIIGLLVFGGFYLNNGQKQNQIQAGQEAIDAAEDAAAQQNDYDDSVQYELDSGPGVNYRGVQQDALKKLK